MVPFRIQPSWLLLVATILLLALAANGKRLADPAQASERQRGLADNGGGDEPDGKRFPASVVGNDDEKDNRIENESPTSFPTTMTSFAASHAASLDVFQNIDPEKFEWVKPENIAAGATTCGFLKPTLGWEPEVNYPTVRVYVCVRFATNQPAPHGNLFVHCGGPSSLSNCPESLALSQSNLDNYNIISIDQRGMGRSTPTLYEKSCDWYHVLSGTRKLQEATGKLDASFVQWYLDNRKEVVKSCWTTPSFRFENIEQPDGSLRSFHFLEYSGTRQLAEDMERFRFLIKAERLSLYGISYGTTVMGTYATMFPSRTNLFVLDGSVTPYNTMEYYALSASKDRSFRYHYLEYSCWAARLENPDNCAIDDIGTCVADIRKMNDDLADAIGLEDEYWKDGIERLLELTTTHPKEMAILCDAAANGNKETVYKLFSWNSPDVDIKGARQAGLCDESYDGPSDIYNPVCFSPMNVVTGLVNGQDYAGSNAQYDDNAFIQMVLRFQDDYFIPEFNGVTMQYMVELATNYYWPKNVPLPVRGNPDHTGIISGQLYDYATSYTWTSEMRQQFPYTTLLTSQGIKHGLRGGPDGPCQKYINDYLESNVADGTGFTDGTVCGDKFSYFDGEIR